MMTHGYDVQYGARPLKRTIQQYIENPLAELLLGDKPKDNYKVTIKKDQITIY